MKKNFLLCVACVIFATAFGQSPNSFKYQAIIRDASGTALPNTEVQVKVNILQTTVSGASVCEEIFIRTTNDFGLINLNLGSENPTSFSNIAWDLGPYFIKVEVDFTGGGSYVEMGTSQLLSVPYALYAENSGTPGPEGPQGPQGIQGIQGNPGSFPAGNAHGDMQYWNGTEWVMIPAGLTNQTLTFCMGIPQWGSCDTTNEPPVATDVIQTGLALVGSTLTGSYTYFDADGDLEGTSLYQWYRAEDASGLNELPISGATGFSYILSSADTTNYIRFAVTPVALTGDLIGEMVMAENFTGPIITPINLAPVATDVIQTGSAQVGSTLTGSYAYFDADGDLEGTSLYQWYRAEDASGLNELPISGATGISYVLSTVDTTKYIRFAVTPVALTGDLTGEMVMAENFTGPITTPGGSFVCGDNITVEYTEGDGIAPVTKTVVYSTVLSSLSGSDQCWITQNLGADHQATSANDDTEASAGWYFQFNLKNGFKIDDDGTRTPNTPWESVTGSTDWLAENDPCASLGEGWRLPTLTEWTVVDSIGDLNTLDDAFASVLKLHAAGNINYNSGNIALRGAFCYSWSINTKFAAVGHCLYGNSSGCAPSTSSKSAGVTIRCIKD